MDKKERREIVGEGEMLLPRMEEFFDSDPGLHQGDNNSGKHARILSNLKQHGYGSRSQRRLGKIDGKKKIRGKGQERFDFSGYEKEQKVGEVFPIFSFKPPEKPYNQDLVFGFDRRHLIEQAKHVENLVTVLTAARGMQVLMGKDVHFSDDKIRYVLQEMEKEEVFWTLIGAGIVRPANPAIYFSRDFRRYEGLMNKKNGKRESGFRDDLERSVADFFVGLAMLGQKENTIDLGLGELEKASNLRDTRWDYTDFYRRMRKFEPLKQMFLERLDMHKDALKLGKHPTHRINWIEFWEIIERGGGSFEIEDWYNEQYNFTRKRTAMFGDKIFELREEHPGKKYMKWIVYRFQRFCYGGDKVDWEKNTKQMRGDIKGIGVDGD